MDFLGDNAYIASGVLQGLAYLVLAVLALLRIGNRWAVLALCGALTSLLPTAWYLVGNLALRFTDSETAMGSAEFFYAPAAQLLMQFLAAVGPVLLVAAVVVGRRTQKEVPVEGPTGTTFRQLPSGIRWE